MHDRSTSPRLILPALAMLFAALFFVPQTAQAASGMYLQLEDESAGAIRGSVRAKGHMDALKVLSISHNLSTARAASGLPTGKRQHKPLVVTLKIDQAMPMLINAWSRASEMSRFELDVVDKKGATQYSIELRRASVCGIRLAASAPGSPEKDQVVVEFCYQKITYVWADGGITAEDDWESPKASKGAPKMGSKARPRK